MTATSILPVWPEVDDSDYAVYSVVLRYLSERSGRSDWVVAPDVDAFQNNGAVLELADGSKRRLTPRLEEAQDTGGLTARLCRVSSDPSEWYTENCLRFSRLAHDPASGEAVVSVSIQSDCLWGVVGPSGLSDGLSSQNVLARATIDVPALLRSQTESLEARVESGDSPKWLLKLGKKGLEDPGQAKDSNGVARAWQCRARLASDML